MVGPVEQLMFSHDGRRLAVSAVALEGDLQAAGDLRVYETDSGRELWNERVPALELQLRFGPPILLSPRGDRIACVVWSGPIQARTHALRIWDVQSPNEPLTTENFATTRFVRDLGWSPDGRWIVAAAQSESIMSALPIHEPRAVGGSKFAVYDSQSGRLVWQFDHPAHEVQFSRDSERLYGIASEGSQTSFKVWEAATGREVHNFALPVGGPSTQMHRQGETMYTALVSNSFLVTLARTKSLMALVTAERALRNRQSHATIWDLMAPERPQVALEGHSAGIGAIAFSPDGRRIASSSGLGGVQGEIKIWNAVTAEELLTLSMPGPPTFLDFSEDGTSLIASRGGLILPDVQAARWSAAPIEASVEAHSLVEALLARTDPVQLPLSAELVAGVEGDLTHSSEVRSSAAALLRRWPRAGELIAAGWQIAISPHEPAVRNKRALAYFDEACINEPENRLAWRGKALAYYRLKQFAEAAAAIAHLRKLHAATGAALAAEELIVEALVAHGQDQAAESQMLLDEIRATQSRDDEDFNALVAELESKLGVPPASAAPENWIGRKFMARMWTRFRDDNGDQLFNQTMPFVVSKVEGDRLWTGASWVERRDAVPLEIAERYQTHYLKLHPKSHLAYYRRALVHGNLGRYTEAEADFTRAIEMAPAPRTDLEYFADRAWARSELGNYEGSLADLNIAVLPKTPYAKPLNMRAWLRATCPIDELRDGTKAVEDAKLACELTGYASFSEMDTLAAAYAESGDFDEAVKQQEKALSLAPAEYRSDVESRLALYRERKPYRETPKSGRAAEDNGGSAAVTSGSP
jgi:tetratricopeptide (TPR) repeat protein